MEENEKKNCKKNFWKGVLVGSLGIGVIFLEISRKGQDIKNVGNFFKKIFNNNSSTPNDAGTQYDQRRNTNGSWNNNSKRGN